MFRILKSISPHSFLVGIAVFFELLLNIVTPPLQAPDEFNHFYRAYQISEGYFSPVKQNNRVGGYMPQGIVDFTIQYKHSALSLVYTTTYKEILSSFKIDLDSRHRQFQDFANTAYYSPVSYAPQAFIISILHLFNASPAIMYYSGKWFTFLLWLVCMSFIIRSLPAFKWLFAMLMVLPMNLYLAGSFSADTVTNMLSFLFIATVIKHVFVTPFITRKHILLIALLLTGLVLAKVVYVGLILLLALIPKNKFGSLKRQVLNFSVLGAWVVILVLGFTHVMMIYYTPYKEYDPAYRDYATLSDCADYNLQKEYILSHGFYFLRVIKNSLFDHAWTYLFGYIGVFGNGDIGFSGWVYAISYSVILLVVLTEQNRFSFTFVQKLLLFSAAFLALALLLLSQHLVWDCVGEGVVDLLQGRYLTPMGPLIFILFSGVWRIKSPFSPLMLILPGIVVLNLSSCGIIYKRFFIGPPSTKEQFSCDVETITPSGLFKTSGAGVFLSNAGNRVNTFHRSGNYSACLSPAAPFCFTYQFRNMRWGDLIEIEAWQKGQGALLVVSARQAGCPEFYFAGTYNSYKDRAGWQRIKNVCFYASKCDSAQAAFYAWSPGKTNVYLDDIKVTITRFKK